MMRHLFNPLYMGMDVSFRGLRVRKIIRKHVYEHTITTIKNSWVKKTETHNNSNNNNLKMLLTESEKCIFLKLKIFFISLSPVKIYFG